MCCTLSFLQRLQGIGRVIRRGQPPPAALAIHLSDAPDNANLTLAVRPSNGTTFLAERFRLLAIALDDAACNSIAGCP